MLQLVLQVSQLLVHLRGAIRVIPELRLVHLFRQLIDLFLDVIDVQRLAGRQNALADPRDILRILFQFQHLFLLLSLLTHYPFF